MPQTIPFEKVIDIAVTAGDIIMKYYHTKLDVQVKDDKSPLTLADIAANNHITAELKKLTPDIPLVSEENDQDINLKTCQSDIFWLVDPLDGTKSFIKGTGEFTVNIALIKQKQSIYGVIYIPVQELLYYTHNGKAYKQQRNKEAEEITVRSIPKEGATVIASLSHRTEETDSYINSIKIHKIVAASSSVKLCKVAEGSADIYPRFGPTMEWDIAAGHAILSAAGGSIETSEGKPFLYGKETLLNPYFIAQGKK